MKKGIIVAILIAIAGGTFFFCQQYMLTGKDKLAYELLLDACYDFKSPSSVRLLSGDVPSFGEEHAIDESPILFMVVEATNGYGAKTTGYYSFIPDLGLSKEKDYDTDSPLYDLSVSAFNLTKRFYEDREALDVKKINRRLERHFK